MSKKELKTLSKSSFTAEVSSLEAINAGSLQRIADATELMAQDRKELLADLEYWKHRVRRLQIENKELRSQIRGLKGWITRYKAEVSKLRDKCKFNLAE